MMATNDALILLTVAAIGAGVTLGVCVGVCVLVGGVTMLCYIVDNMIHIKLNEQPTIEHCQSIITIIIHRSCTQKMLSNLTQQYIKATTDCHLNDTLVSPILTGPTDPGS
jgi:hypothetical protein